MTSRVSWFCIFSAIVATFIPMKSQRKYLIVYILIMYYEQNSLNYDIIDQFPAFNRRAIEVPKEMMNFTYVNN